MRRKALMVQGTGSDCGKSVIVAALCRIFRDKGLRVAPFKAQNMSLNSFVTKEGGEIGRAQATQAMAAGVEPHVDMNPILMKATADTRAQIIFRGRVVKDMSVSEYAQFKNEIFPKVVECFVRLRNQYDLIILEGAGSPAEINLKDQDITNMRMAESAEAPVLLVGDIDRGGVFASLVGTLELLLPQERMRVAALLINKFRGERSLLQSGIDFLTSRTHVPALGVIPYFTRMNLPEEDSLHQLRKTSDRADRISICVIRTPYLSNATDFDALLTEADVELSFVTHPSECENADVVILPGSKSTASDLEWLRRQGFSRSLCARRRRFSIVGICAGFQMLTKKILDPFDVESNLAQVRGLGLISGSTLFEREKRTEQVSGFAPVESATVEGYEIHHGNVMCEEQKPWFLIASNGGQRPEGYADPQRRIYATSIHGVFDKSQFRRAFLNRIRLTRGYPPLAASLENGDIAQEEWAEFVRNHIDMDMLYRILDDR